MSQGGAVGGVGSAATKEFFIPPQNSPPRHFIGNWSYTLLIPTFITYFTFFVPNDFISLTDAVILIIPDTTETVQWDLDVSVAAVGEAFDADNRQSLNVTQAVTVNILTELDVSGDLSSLTPGDYVTVRLTSDITSLQTVLFRFKYA